MKLVLDQIKKYALDNNVPIMLDGGIEFLCNLINKKNIKSILEIGTAIGYSSIKMALVDNDINVTTIERDIDRYNIALENIKKTNLDKRIKCIYGDALDINISGTYDLIFIDAAKGQNIKFFEKYSKLLNQRGIIVVDNIYFHGVIYEKDENLSRNVRQLKRKILEFIEYMKKNKDFSFEVFDDGDGIALITHK